MTDIGAGLTVFFCLTVLALPRRLAALAYVAAAFYITQGQSLEIGDINFMAIRFVEIAAAIRVVMRREVTSIRMTSPDHWLLMFFAAYMGVTLLRVGTLDMYTIGLTVDGLLVFFTFRILISTPDEFTYFMKGMVLLLVPFALLMIEESIKGRNSFSLMGGVPEIPIYREGYFRCQGSFRHAITAGTVGATFFAIFVGFLFQKANRWWALIGGIASLIIVVTSHSSGPLLTTIIVCTAWCCWFFRRYMKWVRLGAVAAFIGLNLVMKAPVWYIFDRISGVIGGDGWHRANLIDKFVKSFGDWCLIGMPMEKTIGWAATVTKFGYTDITNYYISIGINGGLISLVIFIAMLSSCLKLVGLALRSLRNEITIQMNFESILWGVGSAVFAHAVNLTSVSYWDQSYVIWYLHLSVAISLGHYCLKATTMSNTSKKDLKPATRPAFFGQGA
ncbi:MAG: hypothetical protein FJ115_00270 [Deltaproteobacteria bacterium]|nr:hypothetical protein [Deltaproteobacteria bacterium]MBM4321964.1 hypothetical protein [Deltaproteobacteria bacterium]